MESSASENLKMRLFSQYDDHKGNYKPVNDMCFFTYLELGYLTSYNILKTRNQGIVAIKLILSNNACLMFSTQ